MRCSRAAGGVMESRRDDAVPATNRTTPLLEARGISKSFLHVQALDNVDFRVEPGEVVALVGDNGAGKSTLMKTLCGAYQPDAGSIVFDGRSVTLRTQRDAIALGIAVVYQDLALVDHRDVASNVFLGREPTRGAAVDKPRMVRDAREVLNNLKVTIPSVQTLVGLLSGGQRQAVAIARAVHQGGRLIFMDEPTAALGVREQAKVLRGGRNAGERTKAETTPEDIVRLIVGADRIVPAGA